MRFCLSVACCALAGATAVFAAGLDGSVRSVVRVDARTGRLVRTVVASAPTPKTAPGAPAAAASSGSNLIKLIDETAARYALDPLLVHSVIKVESDYNPYAISPKGAEGIMQLMPGTARRFDVANAFNPSENIEGGVRYLKYLLDTFKDQDLAVAAYNAGEKAVARYGTIPPYRETADYVRKVSKRHQQARKLADTNKTASTAAVAGAAAPAIEEFVDESGVVHIRTVQR